ncbi:hypothetical protein [Falsirhodobacter sp. 20TX0035]|uniref:hypothetical protein n=1 Tax=Falsirhodobacter sp. 20TX0035 TaxID=3022019 RepID=UPI00232F98E5|nr:hypothetical protein [Falsirhodobacter sp. 20TX0035]MDB6455003.1 hypothetical protein [Falsirhodobacter sp. 20TX0035]
MTAQDFLAWMDHCGLKTAKQVEEALGWGRNAAARHVASAKVGRSVDIPRYMSLAMSAYSQGLKPWDEYRR